MASLFERKYELEEKRGILSLTQLEEGDVNCAVWDAALVLAKYVETRSARSPDWIQGKRVLELGAGLGCVGLVAACYGGNTILTDQPKALPLLEHNIKNNLDTVKSLKGSILSKGIDWCENCEELPCEILLLADCVYYRESIQPLVKTMLKLSTPETEIILSQEDRSYSEIQKATWEEFCAEVKKYFTTTLIPSSEQHEQFTSSDISLLLLKKKLMKSK